MITIKIRKWTPIGGITHTATSYQVSTNIGFTNIVDNNPTDTVNLDAYYSPVVVPANAVYYVRTKRHFSDNSSSSWGNTVAVEGSVVNAGVVAYDPIKVYAPVVTLDTANLLDPAVTTFTITTNDIVAVNEGHGYTIWAVVDDKGNIIHYRKSTTELTSTTFNKQYTRLLGTKYVKVIVIHGTHTNIESAASVVQVNISNTNFELTTSSDVHSPGIDLSVNIVRNTNSLDNTVTRIELSDFNGTIIQTFPVGSDTDVVVMPGTLFQSDTQYLITGYGSASVSQNTYIIPVRTRADAALNVTDVGYKYRKTVTPGDPNKRFPINGKVSSVELFNGKIPVISTSRVSTILPNDDGTYGTPINMLSNVSIWALAAGGGYIKHLSDDRLLVDYDNGAGASKMSLYNVDYYNNTATLVSTINNTGKHLGHNGGLVKTDIDTFYIGRSNNTAIVKTVLTGASITKTSIPNPTGETHVTLVTKDVGNNILAFFKDSTDIYQYDVDTGIYTKKYVLPIEFRSRTLKQVELINGDVIVWKPLVSESVDGIVVTDGVLDMLYIDNKNSVCEHIVPLTGRTDDMLLAVLTNTGKVLMVSTAVSGINTFEFE